MSFNKQVFFGIVMCLIAITYIALIPFQVSIEPILGAGGRDRINGAFFPAIAGSFLLLTSALLTRRVIKNKPNEKTITLSELGWAILLVGVGVVYVTLIDKMRYIPPTIGLLLLMCHLLKPEGMKKYVYAVFPVGTALIIYFVFSKLFYVPLP